MTHEVKKIAEKLMTATTQDDYLAVAQDLIALTRKAPKREEIGFLRTKNMKMRIYKYGEIYRATGTKNGQYIEIKGLSIEDIKAGVQFA